MNDERWKQVDDILQAALDRAPQERDAFLRQACAGDETLEGEVRSLLATEEEAEKVLEQRAARAIARKQGKEVSVTSDSLIGQTISHYRIVEKLGAGGMGVVWKARDTRLDRFVALKFLPAAKMSDPERKRRFAQEARAASALNHPHIITIYEIDQAGPEARPTDFIAMEYVPGKALDHAIPQKGVRLNLALEYAIQVADALAAAHTAGIVHRDLKPANIMVDDNGSVKVLDFGLAKLTEHAAGGESAPTETIARTPVTSEGAIVGTASYMSPEQAEARKVDARSDIFSFGAVLYEMITGRRAFAGESMVSVLSAILRDEPKPAAEIVQGLPADLNRIVARCLQKDPNRRYQHAGDLKIDLQQVKEELAAGGSVTRQEMPGRLSVSRWSWLAAAAILAAGTVSTIHFREKPPEPPVMRVSIAPPEKNRFNGATPPAVSPDGRQIVFLATSDDGRSQLWLRPLDSLTARPLAGTENASYPFWSPDNRSIGFFAAGKLKKMDVAGGPATTLADASAPRGGTWSHDGVIVFTPTPYSGLQQVPASGGAVRSATRFETGAPPQRFPWFLLDGRHFLYLHGIGAREQRTLRAGSLDSPGEDRTLLDAADSSGMYAQGHLLFVRGTTLVARPFDAKRLAFTGEEVPVAEQILPTRVNNSWPFSVSANGILVYESGVTPLHLTWLDRGGKRLGTVGDPGDLGGVELSPDRKTVATTVYEASSGNYVDIWLYDVLRGLRTRFTFGPATSSNPVWSPDGHVIVFSSSSRSGRYNLYRKPADGSRNEELLYADDPMKRPTSFSPDGKYLAYWVQGDPKTGNDIWILPDPLGTPGASKPYPFIRTEFSEVSPQFSPDGHWIAYQSNESGRYEVYVALFPGPGGKRQVSTAGGTLPRWRADGKELFYRAADNRLMAAEVDAKGGAFEVKKVEPLFGQSVGNTGYDVSADGQRFLTLVPVEGKADTPLTVVQNWTAAIKSGK